MSGTTGRVTTPPGLSEFRGTKTRPLVASLCITVAFMGVELVGGVVTNSIALVNDAGHMFTHAFSVIIALVGARIARRPACHHKTFGSYRAEILAAFLNGVFLVVVVGAMIVEAVERLVEPPEIDSALMFVIALAGLAVNLVSISILHGSQKGDLNVRGVFSHIVADTASSVAVVVAAAVMANTKWYYLDPILSLAIAAAILSWAAGILKESGRILLEIAPRWMNVDKIADDLRRNFPEVDSVSHVHIWTITSNFNVVSLHVALADKEAPPSSTGDLFQRISDFLRERYDVIETTIQVDYDEVISACRL
ncbi:MAG: cation diffusion facilitator family transporter [Promethearchaeota archaeon]